MIYVCSLPCQSFKSHSRLSSLLSLDNVDYISGILICGGMRHLRVVLHSGSRSSKILDRIRVSSLLRKVLTFTACHPTNHKSNVMLSQQSSVLSSRRVLPKLNWLPLQPSARRRGTFGTSVTLRFSMVMSVLSIMSVRHKCKYTIISHGDERSVTFWLTRIPDFLSIKQRLGSYMMYSMYAPARTGSLRIFQQAYLPLQFRIRTSRWVVKPQRVSATGRRLGGIR
jgi:hypothetical protein